MNKTRTKRLGRILINLSERLADLEALRDELRDAADDLPENSRKLDDVEAEADAIEEITDDLNDVVESMRQL